MEFANRITAWAVPVELATPELASCEPFKGERVTAAVLTTSLRVATPPGSEVVMVPIVV